MLSAGYTGISTTLTDVTRSAGRGSISWRRLPSDVVTAARINSSLLVDRYREITTHTPLPELSEGEWNFLRDMLNATLLEPASAIRFLWMSAEANLADGLAEKWEVDGPGLVEWLRAATTAQPSRWSSGSNPGGQISAAARPATSPKKTRPPDFAWTIGPASNPPGNLRATDDQIA